MQRKYIPAFVMLLAGAVTSIVEIITKMDVLKSLKILLAVLIIFYIIGCIAKAIVIKVLDDGQGDEEGMDYEDENGMPVPLEDDGQQDGQDNEAPDTEASDTGGDNAETAAQIGENF